MRRTSVRPLLTLLLVLAGCHAGEPCEDGSECEAERVCSVRGACVRPAPGVCAIRRATFEVEPAGAPQLDLLFVIDDTTRIEWQADLIAEVPRLLTALARGGLPGFEGSATSVDSFHLGVVTSDMGTGPDGACGSVFGKDGLLQTVGDLSAFCLADHPPWLEFGARPLDLRDGGDHARCVMSALGYQGCGFEQPLEATLKALTPRTSPLRFSGNTVGHADGANAGFLREDSLLAIITLGDEDDCSAHDTDVYDLEDPSITIPANLRCIHEPSLHPISRYVEGLLTLRDDPGRLFYGVLGGVPVDAVPSEDAPVTPQLEALLSDARMESRQAELDSTQLVASCDRPGEGRAYPPERIVRVAHGLAEAGASVWVDSTCRETLTDPVDRMARVIAAALGPSCLPHAIERRPDGRVPCELVEIVDGACGPGRVLLEPEEPGRTRCAIEQRVALDVLPTEPGWFYDDFGPAAVGCADGPHRVAFSGGLEPSGTLVLECEQRVGGTELGVGTHCAVHADCAELPADAPFPLGLGCDHRSGGTCQPRCETDRDCDGDFRCEAETGFCTCY